MITNKTCQESTHALIPVDDTREPEENQIVPFSLFHLYANSPFVEVFQAEVAFTDATDSKPVLASYGAGPCIILAGFSHEHKAGFLAHFSCYQEVFASYYKINTLIKTFLKGRSTHISLFLTGGIIGNPISKNTYKTIKDLYIKSKNSTNSYSMLLNDPLRPDEEHSKSLALDTRLGTISSYDPRRDNPVSFRKLTLEDIHWAQNSFEKNPNLKLVYPKST